ncbi:uncharacterized protein MELLADRAFT_73286 [Melampsora larici-populina 98AG31]|uniref:Uncharacterized protein n=1 Tax=Melampsora larici-populina (strain 98AG31 / pathotype 3-4-7) TaxID=747676 RepID=F4S5V7_MELLP|nr:uncharacterized protein MELLADRAFT_73286 [Melampsora larici-populina 98AG31]EGF99999.1 hypothetical protein MELLADRAFT_73286 [Melampsora larici-populina 98AG31]
MIIEIEDEAEELYKRSSEIEVSKIKTQNHRTLRESMNRTRMSYRLNAGFVEFTRKVLLDEVYVDGIKKSGIGF